jgi:hypothetical protein
MASLLLWLRRSQLADNMLSNSILKFLQSLSIDTNLPKGVEILNPYQHKITFSYCEQFYKKFYPDNEARTLILGINPGRLGAGLTGIPFTDPIKLEDLCGIKNNLPKRAELSADFIYQVIAAFGGWQKFYAKFYFSSVSPLGFVRENKNLNYYDVPELQKSLKPFIEQSLIKQMTFGLNRNTCFVLGEGKNFQYVQSLNSELKIFEKLIPLSHPRFVMQYKRKQLSHYVRNYLKKLQSVE